MTINNDDNKAPIFVGRKKELSDLKGSWQLAKQGKPQIVILKADSGLGKTRILQHFYSWISHPENGDDPQAYWPDNLEKSHNSLNINPDFSHYQGAGEIPWLWWGIRFNKPAQRNQLDISECAMANALLKLEPHFLPLLQAQEKRQLTEDSVNHLANSMLGLLGLGVLSSALAVKDAYKTYQEEKKRQQKTSIEELEQEKTQDIKDKIKSYFTALMDKKNKDINSIPVILVLDDAQWADPDTLIFVEWLCQHSLKNKYPLLILASHWKQEWNTQEQACSESRLGDPESFPHLIKRNQANLTQNLQQIELKKLPNEHLQVLISDLLPGITVEQQQLLLQKADGVPVYLEQLILYLQSNPKNNKKKNIKGESTDRACKHINELTVNQEGSFDALCKARFEALEPNIKEILGWSSHQGLRFVREFSLALAKRMQSISPAPEKDLKQATNPFSIIESINELSSEFCHRELHRAAYNELLEFGEEDEDYINFKDAMLQELLYWQHQERIKSLDTKEQTNILKLLITELKQNNPISDAYIKSLGEALLSLIEVYLKTSQSREINEASLILVGIMQTKKWRPDECKLLILNSAGVSLLKFSQLDEAIIIFSEIIDIMRWYQFDVKDGNEKQHYLAMIYLNRGTVYLEIGNNEAAVSDYNRAIDYMEHLREVRGEEWSPGMQNDLASAYLNRGNAYRKIGDNEAAISAYERAIGLRKHLREVLDEKWSPCMQNDLASAYVNRGVAYHDKGDTEAAISVYEQAIDYMEHLREVQGEQWPLDMQNNLAKVYVNRGSVYYREIGDNEAAISDYDRAIGYMEHLREVQGEQWPPGGQNALALVYMNRGFAYRETGDNEAAISNYDRAIGFLENLKEVWGEQWPLGMKNGLANDYVIRGNAYRETGDNEAAISNYDRAIGYMEHLREVMGEQWMLDLQDSLAIVYMKRGDAYRKIRDIEAFINSYLIANKIFIELTLNDPDFNQLELILSLCQDILIHLKQQPDLNHQQAENLLALIQNFFDQAQNSHLSVTDENQQYLESLAELIRDVKVLLV